MGALATRHMCLPLIGRTVATSNRIARFNIAVPILCGLTWLRNILALRDKKRCPGEAIRNLPANVREFGQVLTAKAVIGTSISDVNLSNTPDRCAVTNQVLSVICSRRKHQWWLTAEGLRLEWPSARRLAPSCATRSSVFTVTVFLHRGQPQSSRFNVFPKRPSLAF